MGSIKVAAAMDVIEIAHMPHLDELVEQEDNWTGVTDPKERRKRQNRLHQRAWRRRQAAQRVSNNGDGELPDGSTMQVVMRAVAPRGYNASRSLPAAGASYRNMAGGPAVSTRYPLPTSRSETRCNINPRIPDQVKELHAIFRFASELRPVSSVLLSDVFPLSPDHKLITLIQYNVMRGMYTNTVMLCLLDQLKWDCGYGLNIVALPYVPSKCPPNFEPTRIQETIDHDVWIDIIPYPELRDNLILHHGRFDNDELCDDMVGGLYEGFDDVQVRGIMLWGEPWSLEGWEVSEGFLKRWGFLLQGCHSLQASTNRWREARGEDKMLF